MTEPKTYFILRNTDYKPDGLIQLGQLVSDPRKPYRRLCPPSQPAPETHTSEKVNWSFDRSEATSGEASIFAKFLSVLTASASGTCVSDLSQEEEEIELGDIREVEVEDEDFGLIYRTGASRWMPSMRMMGRSAWSSCQSKNCRPDGILMADKGCSN